ncbi:hypothetical protein [Nocardia colli]|uniref:hypothetical protein n=1 Tax=Nocardia colli TaxID=2545717 RepID=UPI00168D26DB|nr:hypothetical protein [Nocardia colli]
MATRRRRWTVRLVAAVFVLIVFPCVLGAVATAQTGASIPSNAGGNSALNWMDVRDTSGVPVSRYFFTSDSGSLLDPAGIVLSTLINLEFAGWLVIVTSSIWLIGYVMSYQWLDMFSKPLRGAAEGFSSQLATPLMLATGVTIGAFFVGWFVVRGYYAKATSQIVTMFAVAVFGPVFLAEPLANALSSGGVVAQGRDMGLSVAAGLNGDNNPNPHELVATMQTQMADQWVRKPLQVWNFGHVIDARPACGSAWTAGIAAGNDKMVHNGIVACQDPQAVAAMRHATVGQLGSGFALLFGGGILLLFAVYLCLKLMKAVLDAVYHSFLAILGFVAGGYIYGPTQTFLIRSVVDVFMAGAKVGGYTIATGGYLILIGNVFTQAGDDGVMKVLLIGAFVELVAIFQLRELGKRFKGASEWIANRISQQAQGPNTRSGGGGGGGGGGGSGGGGRALGMGSSGGGHSSGLGLLTLLAASQAVGGSTPVERLLGIRDPLKYKSRLGQAGWDAQMTAWSKIGPQYEVSYWVHEQIVDSARRAFADPTKFQVGNSIVGNRRRMSIIGGGGLDTARGAIGVLDGMRKDGNIPIEKLWAGLHMNGFSPEVNQRAYAAYSQVMGRAEDEQLRFGPVSNAVSAMDYFIKGPGRDPYRLAMVESTVADWASNVQAWPISTAHQRLARTYMANPTDAMLENLRNIAGGRGTGVVGGVTLDREQAQRVMSWIGNERAQDAVEAMANLLSMPEGTLDSVAADRHITRLQRAISEGASDDLSMTGVRRTGYNSAPAPPP